MAISSVSPTMVAPSRPAPPPSLIIDLAGAIHPGRRENLRTSPISRSIAVIFALAPRGWALAMMRLDPSNATNYPNLASAYMSLGLLDQAGVAFMPLGIDHLQGLCPGACREENTVDRRRNWQTLFSTHGVAPPFAMRGLAGAGQRPTECSRRFPPRGLSSTPHPYLAPTPHRS